MNTSSSRRRVHPGLVILATTTALLSLSVGGPLAQSVQAHLNPVIDKLARGELVFGVSTDILSVGNARALASAGIDYVYVDMEHSPMNFDTLQGFLFGLTDKAAILKKNSLQPNVATLARFAPYGREQAEWVVKQALDIGLMGILFPTIETKDQALLAVRNMRYPQRKGSRYMEPLGLRGNGPQIAAWLWGLPVPEYVQRADLWPLNPQGELLALMMIESAEGLRNVDEIAAVPGVAGFYVGDNDLANSLGVPPGSAEAEAAIASIAKACQAHRSACGISAESAEDMQKRIKQGFRILGGGGIKGGLTPTADAALRAGRGAAR